jgi:hypothetical protein
MEKAIMRQAFVRVSVFACLSLGMCALALAGGTQDNPSGRGTKDKFSISFGSYLVRFDTTARVDSEELGTGTEIDLENDTGLGRDETELALDGYYRFGKRHRVDFGAAFLSRGATSVIDETIQFEDQVFDIDALVTTKFSNDIVSLAYHYSFVRNPKIEAGVSIGFSAFMIDASLSAEGEGGMVSRATEDFIAPIPVIGLDVDVPLGHDLFFKAGGEYFNISVDDWKGKLTNLNTSINWHPYEHWGFGVGYNRYKLKYEDLGIPQVDVELTYAGMTLYATYVF